MPAIDAHRERLDNYGDLRKKIAPIAQWRAVTRDGRLISMRDAQTRHSHAYTVGYPAFFCRTLDRAAFFFALRS